MNSTKKIIYIAFITSIISGCNYKKPEPVIEKNTSKTVINLQTSKNEKSIEGIYETNDTGDCKISVEIIKAKEGYWYTFKTKSRKLNGKAIFITNESGEKYITLKGIKWDEYEGDISHETDSITDSGTETKELEIPVGIEASYAKDTLTIQNYGNAMNSYTKISECDRKYIQLIKK